MRICLPFDHHDAHPAHSTLTPLVSSAIFYASNGEFHISYIDGLFCCVSAMTVTGLATIDLSECTGFQQALLFILQCLGNTVGRPSTRVVHVPYVREGDRGMDYGLYSAVRKLTLSYCYAKPD